jgi:hypothetical protein
MDPPLRGELHNRKAAKFVRQIYTIPQKEKVMQIVSVFSGNSYQVL